MFSFVQKIENCTFPEAVHILAEKAGVQVEKYHARPQQKEEKQHLYAAMEEAAAFFEAQLHESKKAKTIVSERKISKQTLRLFRVGYAPDARHALEKHLLEKGFSRKDMKEAGLLSVGANSETHDKFRNRIMFPIWNGLGRICAFGGRYIGEYENAPKYLNSPDTKLYKKSSILYGLHTAKEAIKKEQYVLLVEGYYDVLACHDAGIHNVVAVSGTAFTLEHVRILSRYAKTVVLALDVDAAGQAAARKAAALCLKKGLSVEVVSIPGGKDPDEAIRENREEFLQCVAQRENALDVFFTRAFLHRNPKVLHDKTVILDELLPVISALPREIERDHYKQLLAEKMATNVHVIDQEYRNMTRFSPVPSKEDKKRPTQQKNRFAYLLSLCLAFPELMEEMEAHLLTDLLPENEEKKIYKLMRSEYTSAGVLSPEKIWEHISSEESEKWRVYALDAEEKWKHFSDVIRRQECKKILIDINKALVLKKIDELSSQLKHSPENESETIVQINELTKLLHTFHTS